MAEYICKDDLLKKLKEASPLPFFETNILIGAILVFPTADVQPVVRCKDCKHFHLDYFGEVYGANIIVAHEICDLWAGGCKTMQNAFCSNGVRADGET